MGDAGSWHGIGDRAGCESPYRAGRSPDWIKVKNRQHSALQRVKEAFS